MSARVSGCAAVGYVLLTWPVSLLAQPPKDCHEQVQAHLRVDTGHPWRPPFGVARVGAPPAVHVEIKTNREPRGEYYVAAYREGKEVERQTLSLARNPLTGLMKPDDGAPFYGNMHLKSLPEEIALYARCSRDARSQEIARQPVSWPQVEADAEARPDRQINPVDLGAILPPHDWLLLAGGQKALIDVAALSRTRSLPNARLKAWFEDGKPVELALPLAKNRRVTKRLEMAFASHGDRSVLHVSLVEGNRVLWAKAIRTMVVRQPPPLPAFGAIQTKLRYDAPIAMADTKTGEPRASIDYSTAWNPKLNDVVVFLPNGSRFVFWRGASYVPFWARRDNIGLGYQFAENLSHLIRHADGSVDYAEPIKDFELRYGSVEILESTQSRIHVRWIYQGTDFDYNVTGDQAIEDFYFYPDGFGTRALTVTSAPSPKYELTEFMAITPQAALPLEAIASPTIDILALDRRTARLAFPLQRSIPAEWRPHIELSNLPDTPSVYRIRSSANDRRGVVYFGPHDPPPSHAYAPIYQQGEMITPAFWGSHWPLNRRGWLGWGAVDDSVYAGPAHNSLITWLTHESLPSLTSTFTMPDSRGQAREMLTRRWVWLISDTDADDDALRDWGHSFSEPPSLKVTGARIDFPSYSPERRALRLIAESSSIEIKLEPVMRTVNPVFEVDGAPQTLTSVTLNGQALPADAYAWDGATLWMKALIGAGGATINLRFR